MIVKKEYSDAVNAFSKLIKQYPARGDVNKWYGEALFETGRYEDAEEYLAKAARLKVAGAYPYLGQVYLRQYQFDKALDAFKKYAVAVKKDPILTETANQLVEQAENCKKALTRVEEVIFIDSMIVDKKTFFKYYKLSQETGKLLDYELLEKADSAFTNVIFESQRGDRRLFGKKTDDKGYDLFESSRLFGNKWSDLIRLPNNINSAGNELFPFVLNDGMTLYFASDKEPTLGGYDLYITKYSTQSSAYLVPEKLPMPFNSPFNDYMMAIDEENGIGWFATDRFQREGYVAIYLFIPNSVKRYYRDIPAAEILDYAKITSIQATWPENASYEKMLNAIYNAEDKLHNGNEEFFFVINDNIIYTNYSDFEDTKARQYFRTYEANLKKKEELEKNLDDMRSKWTKANASQKNTLKPQILKAENELLNLENTIDDLELNARNLEIEYLKKKRK